MSAFVTKARMDKRLFALDVQVSRQRNTLQSRAASTRGGCAPQLIGDEDPLTFSEGVPASFASAAGLRRGSRQLCSRSGEGPAAAEPPCVKRTGREAFLC